MCISIGDSSDDLKHTLLNWINLHIENKISKTDLEIYCSKNSSVSTIVKVNTNLDFIIKTNYAVNNEIAITSISPKSKNKLSLLLLGFLSIILIVFAFTTCLTIHSTILEKHNQISNRASRAAAIKNKTPKTNILVYFKYKEIDKSKLIIFLNSHNSLLAEEPYFSTIIAVSKQYDLNPLILFAITGQEENFVSKQDSNSKKIANNPYNVYHSWQDYNTNIKDASEIASLTVINLSKDRPANEEPFHWINRQYAEDPNWSKGVKKIYDDLEKNDSHGK